jgi:hypothetical protein
MAYRITKNFKRVRVLSIRGAHVPAVDPATTSFDAPSVLVTSRPGMSLRIANHVMMTRELLSDATIRLP